MGGAQADAHSLLSQVFGFDEFRPMQGEIVDAVTAGEDVLAILPTGGGKSLCFQLPALLRPGLTVVISPLIALPASSGVPHMKASISALLLLCVPSVAQLSSPPDAVDINPDPNIVEVNLVAEETTWEFTPG